MKTLMKHCLASYVGERIYPRWAKEFVPTEAQLICFNKKRGRGSLPETRNKRNIKMKTLVWFTTLLTMLANVHMAQAGIIDYNVTLIFTDDTTFRGSFEYNADNQQITNLHGELDDVLMGNKETIKYQLGSGSDGKGGITAYAFAENTTVIGTNPPLNNNVGVGINFNAIDPTLGATDPTQLAYMDCSPIGLMGNTCMYYISSWNPQVPMEGGHGLLSQVITPIGQVSRSDCLFNWAEKNYPQLFSPAGAASQTLSPYYYRYYQNTNSYVGISSLDNHVYYLDPNGKLQDVGQLSTWLPEVGC